MQTTNHQAQSTPLRIAHRGASGAYPENTLLAFRKGLELGAQAFELDVHLCKSGEPVVIHDATLKRTTNTVGRVADFTLQELQKLDAGGGERISTLAEVLDEFARKATVFIEVKAEAAAAPVAALISSHASRGIPYAHMPVIGFNPKWLLSVKQRDAQIQIGASPDDRKPIPSTYLGWAKENGFFSVNPNHKQLSPRFVERARALDLRIYTWTVNKPADIARVKSLGVDGIMSDYPDRL